MHKEEPLGCAKLFQKPLPSVAGVPNEQEVNSDLLLEKPVVVLHR